ncbi:dihydrofolate reductase [Corynebacterium glutamicum]|uniref:dihydrofolate reductase n=1 Tax=Corynebacterium glutamicum TaxID=1718 RepID=A0AB36I5J4_CORGT|nr:dihydrofolate reductase [Corynebacterium glutamicum]AGN18612.1 hypothetical protein C624_05135 [Corynebacterium glutamicum SCgG1]AGN21635.1 hypothetical protein C629_05135 [Corynebacterium glutamicum SCgG2]EGV39273.1 hypothetical protein CgS9114_13760 [Corynebacterium glutamicum S9114]EOA63218.1 dihydrofolate reductase [Corynebacterium glutamicum MT]EPP41234.1 hypothetical protein A583_04650 [Corynebacterium glutamicum Z188]
MIGAIWAQGRDGIIGDGTDMPWHIPEDLKHFKKTTMGQPVIMGRRTWESLPFKPLPGRENFILSSREPGDWSAGGTVVTEIPKSGWIMGGGEVYKATVGSADVLEITLIDATFDVSTPVYAPEIPANFNLDDESEWLTSGEYRYKFQRYIKV